MRSCLKTVSQTLRRRAQIGGMAAALLIGFTAAAAAQAIEIRQWQGAKAAARQPEQVVASTNAEWRSLWSRVGASPPDFFEPGRTSAVGIFLGPRNGEGYSVNVLSTSRRRDRIMVVFEERVPTAAMTAQRAVPAPRPALNAPSMGTGSPSFAPSSGSIASLPPPSAPLGHATSPWVILLINRADLPVSVEQRLFR